MRFQEDEETPGGDQPETPAEPAPEAEGSGDEDQSAPEGEGEEPTE